MVFNDKEQDVFKKLSKLTLESSEGEYNYELLTGGISNEDFDILIEYYENEIKFVKSHPDSKKRFDTAMTFFKKLESKNLYDSFKKLTSSTSLFDAKKVSSGKLHTENLRKYENEPDSEEKIDAICKFYVHSYERFCRLFLKPMAQVIMNKKIHECGKCIERIIEFDPDMKFLLEPFIPQIRNSIDHLDYYYDSNKKLLVFEDRDKPPLMASTDQIRIRTTLQVASEVATSTADHALNLDLYKLSQHYFKKTKEYCRILGVNYEKIVVAWVSEGRNILSLYTALERMIKQIK